MGRTHNSYNMTEAYFARFYQDYLGSGLTKKEYCLRMGCSRTSFYSWKKKWGNKLRLCGHEEILVADPPLLVPINIIPEEPASTLVSPRPSKTKSSSSSKSPNIEISLPSGVHIRFSGDIKAELLLSILNTL